AQHQALRVLQDSRRRYQDIFEGSGVALCVLDLFEVRAFLEAQGLQHSAQLMPWLAEDETRHAELLRRIRISEVNRVTLQLLGVDSDEQVWHYLIGYAPLRPEGARH